MKRNYRFFLLCGGVLAVLVLGFSAQAWGQELPKGVKVELVAEYPGKTAGVEKIQLMKFTFQPGAIIKNQKEDHTAL